MRSVPFEFVCGLACEFGAVEVFWRESDASFTGFVAEVWCLLWRRYANESLPREFAVRWAEVVGYAVKVRCVSSGPARFAVSVPCGVPGGLGSPACHYPHSKTAGITTEFAVDQ